MKVIRSITVKYIVTEQKKAEIIAQFEQNLLQTKREIEQLTFQLHKALHDAAEHQHYRIKERFQKDLTIREDKLKNIAFQINQAESLTIGMEIEGEKVDSILEVEIGQPWSNLNQPAEIIVKDGIIQEIREGR